jgi:phage anti-repressor protein
MDHIYELPSWCTQYVESAICSSDKLVTIQEFIQLTNYPIDKATFDILYLRIKEDMDVYIDATLLEWMGYSGVVVEKQKAFLKLLKRNFTANEDYTIHKNNAYKEYFKNIKSVHLTPLNYVYPNPAIGASARRIKHILLKPDTFKAMSMMLNTGKGKRIRKYYIAIEKLMKAYDTYICAYYMLNSNEEWYNVFKLKHIKKYTRQCTISQLNEYLQKKYKIGCIYFIQESITKNIKIGWCWNLPRRLSQLQVANSSNLLILKTELCQFPHEREQYLHKKYANYHIRGEWFSYQVLL